MQYIATKDLKPHPRNTEFFDDITGDKWEDFKKSIVRRGVVEGVVVTQDLLIVSGHQRVRACLELGILEVPCRITHYPDEDSQTKNPKEDLIIEDLISTNILQRGIGNVNPMKMANCINELKRIYGIKQGNNQNSKSNNFTSNSLAENIGLTRQQLNNFEKLNKLIPELQDMVEDGQLKATTAQFVWAKMTKTEQEKFFNEIGKDQISKMTQKQTQEYLKLQEEVEQLKKKLNNQPVTVKEVVVEKVIDNTDYEQINQLKIQLESEKKDAKTLEDKVVELEKKRIEYESKLKEINDNSKKEDEEIEKLKKQKEKLELQAHISISDLQIKIHNFINDASPSVFLQGAVAASSFKLKDDLLDSVIALEEFTRSLRSILDSEVKQNQNNIIEMN